MDRIPERRLTDEARARRRTELMAAIAADDGDQARGRRWLVPAAAAAAVAVVGGAAFLASTAGSDQGEESPAPVGGGSGADDPSTTLPPEEPCDVTSASLPPVGASEGSAARMRLHPELRTYRAIVARHLDPDEQHLDRKVTNQQSNSGKCGLLALGTKLGWKVEGEDGLGMVEVEVSDGINNGSQVGLLHGGWSPVQLDRPGVKRAKVAEYPEGTAVAVTRTDGLTVWIHAAELFGNNSQLPISGFDFSTEDLLDTAADPEFTLP
jgi:hypothetical protein